MLSKYSDIAQVMPSGSKSTDMAHTVKEETEIFLFTVPRNGMEFLSYRFIESLKDRMVFSGKYGSTMKMLRKTPHVIVFSNEDPDRTQLTADRYVVYQGEHNFPTNLAVQAIGEDEDSMISPDDIAELLE